MDDEGWFPKEHLTKALTFRVEHEQEGFCKWYFRSTAIVLWKYSLVQAKAFLTFSTT